MLMNTNLFTVPHGYVELITEISLCKATIWFDSLLRSSVDIWAYRNILNLHGGADGKLQP
jgi:hypothetical protein